MLFSLNLIFLLSFLSLPPATTLAFEPNQITMSTPSSSLPTNKTIYLGYGSNLWLHQMSQRCPTATYLGVARLDGYKWIISTRGYANVVEVSDSKDASVGGASVGGKSKGKGKEEGNGKYDDVVFGLIYTLEPSDEERLDKNEGVPVAYTKEYLPCEFWTAGPPSDPLDPHKAVDTTTPPTGKSDMLVYIDRKRTAEGTPREEYVVRMNRGVSDAVDMGVPGGYVKGVVRRFIKEGDGGEGVKEWAERQARGFRDESGVF